MSCAHSIDRRAGCNGTRRRPEGLGVRVVKRSPDLTVTLVSDYLEGRLAELNRQHLSDRTPWLLVQPSGIFPLVGPVFSPGKSACWTCLADRMIRNREVKGFLDRGQARRVAVSPLARNTFGQSAIQLAAVEIAKAIATDFRTELRDHIISLDLLGSTIAQALRGGPPAMSEPAAARSCATRAARRCRSSWRRRQAGDDERRVPDRFVAGHGGAFPQAREPAHRRGLASRADRSRSALEHQLPCPAQFFGAGPRRSTSSGRD